MALFRRGLEEGRRTGVAMLREPVLPADFRVNGMSVGDQGPLLGRKIL
jgi:hypothetical protein